MLKVQTIKFLRDLSKNNNKVWFDEHRPQYESAKVNFLELIQQVIDKLGRKDESIKNLAAKDCIFRINRDIRFAKDKTPYKNNLAASINKGGKKAVNSAGYYFHLEPGKSFAGGGIYMPEPAVLKKVRQEIDYSFSDFKNILAAKKFKSVYGGIDMDAEYLLSRVPKGYEPGNPAGEYLKLKSYLATVNFTDKDLGSPDLVKKTVAAFEALQPLIEFLNKSME